MYVVDANVLLYPVNRAAPRHAGAREWLDAALANEEPVGFAWTVILAFLRLATNPAVFARPLRATDAIATVEAWLGQPAASVVDPTARHVGILRGLLADTGTAGNLVSDAHLAALAVEYDATLVSFDADFGRYRGVRWSQPGR